MKDNFSKQADIYAKYRPAYPQELFDFVLQHIVEKQNAWDCATGNGQSAKVLAEYFENVYATDISQKQIDKATQTLNIYYSVQPAEQTNFADNTFDLITVSQALHWFATDKFYTEAKRVAKPHSIFAAWSYSLLYTHPAIDELIRSFYRDVIGPYWDEERKYVDEQYQTIYFPFREITSPAVSMEYYWTIEELEGYLNTWSALQKFILANEYNPVDELIRKIKPYAGNERLKIIFPLHIRMGRIEK
ncbi:MAG: class I SAM-dependent methyltransferase [Bacteroidota bacterium]|nr:class I SAM-dependent methyltransferase [Bacteroidota bacterium]